ncbi:MAG: hypothetical protein N3B12_00755, partial [Armatimonadetes bacterium]|nr:hypothetical protein [Armatimonadota bacterium]
LEATKQYVVSRKQYEGIRTDSGMPLPTLVHNTYLHIAQENGLLGAGILYGGILHLCLVCWRVYRRAPDQGPLGKNFVGIIGLSFVMWFVATTAYNNDIAQYPNGLLWSYFALVTRYGQILQEKKTAIQAEEVSTGRLESGYRPRLQPGRAI